MEPKYEETAPPIELKLEGIFLTSLYIYLGTALDVTVNACKQKARPNQSLALNLFF